MSLSVVLGKIRGGGLIQVIGRIGDNIETKSDRFAQSMITREHRYTKEGWPVDTGYSLSTIEPPRKISDGHYQFRITAPYAGVIEYGGYRGVGPKTSQQGGETLSGDISINAGIYPIQRPSAPLRRAKSRVKLEMSQIAAAELARSGGGAK